MLIILRMKGSFMRARNGASANCSKREKTGMLVNGSKTKCLEKVTIILERGSIREIFSMVNSMDRVP